MFGPVEFFVGLRYFWSRQRRGLVSFMSAASLAGIALGVTALIVVLSVMNGLETEARDRLLSLSAHATLNYPQIGESGGAVSQIPSLNTEQVMAQIESLPGVSGTAPFINVEGMLSFSGRLTPALIRGVDPQAEQRISGIAELITEGSWSDLSVTGDGVVVGRALALNLGVHVGDRLTLLHAKVVGGQPRPNLLQLTVVGIFTAGFADHDGALALINIDKAAAIVAAEVSSPSLALRVDDPLYVARIRAAVAGDSDLSQYIYSDWTIEHRSHFRAIEIEKMMMTIILLLIVAVAAFNIVASLVMVVNDKTTDIAIMRTFGLAPSKVARVFVFQGAIIGVVGTLLGTVLGTLLAWNVERIVPWLESTFSFKIMPGDVYYVTEIPSEPHMTDVVIIAAAALIVSLAATYYPSRRAAKIAPAEALRYD